MKAVILAAGKGRRLWPLTENRPKPMLPVGNRPILDHIVTELEATPVREVILVVGSNRERVQTYFEDGRDRDLDITYVTQEPQLGTGHALLQAESHVGDSVVVCNGDRIVDADAIDAVWERHRQTGDPTVAITRADHPHKYGIVDFAADGLAEIEEPPRPDQVAPSTPTRRSTRCRTTFSPRFVRPTTAANTPSPPPFLSWSRPDGCASSGIGASGSMSQNRGPPRDHPCDPREYLDQLPRHGHGCAIDRGRRQRPTRCAHHPHERADPERRHE